MLKLFSLDLYWPEEETESSTLYVYYIRYQTYSDGTESAHHKENRAFFHYFIFVACCRYLIETQH